MITIYKKKAIKNMELVALNDVYFNKYTSDMLDEKAADIIKKIDCSEMLDKYTIRSRFNGNVLNIDKLSTGCKTVLNIFDKPREQTKPLSIAQASKFITEQCKGAGNKKFILREV